MIGSHVRELDSVEVQLVAGGQYAPLQPVAPAPGGPTRPPIVFYPLPEPLPPIEQPTIPTPFPVPLSPSGFY